MSIENSEVEKHPGPTTEAEHQAKELLLIQIAQEFGYDGEVRSLAELTHRRWPEAPVSHEIEVANAARRMGLVSETLSSTVVDNFRAVLEATQGDPRDKPYFDRVRDYGEEEVLVHWEELEFLLGIDDDTSQVDMDELDKAASKAWREGKRGADIPYNPRVMAGTVPFESQEAGDWGKGFTW